jgi:hypothetical protein
MAKAWQTAQWQTRVPELSIENDVTLNFRVKNKAMTT